MKFLVLSLLFVSIISGQKVHADSKGSLESFGDIGQHLVPVTALCISLSKGDREGAFQLLKTSAATMAAVYGIKYATCCTRPYGGRYSFPSGHTACAFMGAAYLDKRYGFVYAFPGIIISSVVGYSRTQSENHHMRDVVVGAFIAYISAWTLTTPYENNRVIITPLCEEGCKGVSFSKRF